MMATVTPTAPGTMTNSAGGKSYVLSDMRRLARFCVLGSASTCYARDHDNQRELTHLMNKILNQGGGQEAIAILASISTDGLAHKQRTTLYALAACAFWGDTNVRPALDDSFGKIVRTPTHLFEYLDLYSTIAASDTSRGKGWGRWHRKLIAKWYECHKNGHARDAAQSLTKINKRHNWSHSDALGLCHARPQSNAFQLLYHFVSRKGRIMPAPNDGVEDGDTVITRDFLMAVSFAKSLTSSDSDTMVRLIERHRLVHEHVPSTLQRDAKVWQALFKHMPLHALIRNLGRLSSMGVFNDEQGNFTRKVCARLQDAEKLRSARVHPVAALLALAAYQGGQSPSYKWIPVTPIVDALQESFNLAFRAVEPSGKRFLLGLDVSGSMTVPMDCGISCREGAAAMALVTATTEPHCTTMCFADTFAPFPITPKSTLTEVTQRMHNAQFGPTDCAKPMQYAIEHSLKIDVFVVYTDSETYYGDEHPTNALHRYRAVSGISDAKLIVVGMVSNGFTIADPADPNTLDVIGFDSSTPSKISAFAAGRV